MLAGHCTLCFYYIGVNGQYTVTIDSTPPGTAVSGSTTTFDYPILSNVTLTCMVDPSPPAGATYRWNTACFVNNAHNTQTCFPFGQTTQSVTGYHLLAEDAGNIFCTVNISGDDYSSDQFTFRVSGMRLIKFSLSCNYLCSNYNLNCYCLTISGVVRR